MDKPRLFLGSSGKQAKLLEVLTRGLAPDDWTTTSLPGTPAPWAGQASPRDNVVFEAGLFGGVLGMRRTFILHASGAKLPTDLLGLTCARYAATSAAEMRAVIQQLRKAIESQAQTNSFRERQQQRRKPQHCQ